MIAYDAAKTVQPELLTIALKNGSSPFERGPDGKNAWDYVRENWVGLMGDYESELAARCRSAVNAMSEYRPQNQSEIAQLQSLGLSVSRLHSKQAKAFDLIEESIERDFQGLSAAGDVAKYSRAQLLSAEHVRRAVLTSRSWENLKTLPEKDLQELALRQKEEIARGSSEGEALASEWIEQLKRARQNTPGSSLSRGLNDLFPSAPKPNFYEAKNDQRERERSHQIIMNQDDERSLDRAHDLSGEVNKAASELFDEPSDDPSLYVGIPKLNKSRVLAHRQSSPTQKPSSLPFSSNQQG